MKQSIETLKGLNTEWIKENYPEQAKSKKAFIFGISQSKNEDYVIVGVVQFAETEPKSLQERIAAKNNNWTNTSAMICYMPVLVEAVQEMKMEVGKFLNDIYGEETNVRKKLTLIQRKWQGGESTPVVNPKTGEIQKWNGIPFYQEAFLDSEIKTFDARQQDYENLLLLEEKANKVETEIF